MTDNVLRYHKLAARPSLEFWIRDRTGALIDFSVGYTFTFRIGHKGSAAEVTIPTGQIAGAAGSGTSSSGTPNITISPAVGDLDLAPGAYDWTLTAVNTSLPRIYSGTFEVAGVMT